MKNPVDEIREILQAYVEKEHQGVLSRAAKALEVPYMSLKQWVEGTRSPTIAAIAPIFEKLGLSISRTHNAEPDKDVCFVDARIVPSGEGQRPPEVENYLAVPMVGEAGAGPGIIPQDELLSWFIVYRNTPSIMHRRNLIAVQIAPRSTSMEPLLHPGDIVLVDRSDKDVSRPGRIMLVMEPDDGAGKIKRVSVEPLRGEGKDCRITFYSDNAAHNPPEVMRLNKDYGGDMSKAIVGSVVWAWSDVSNK